MIKETRVNFHCHSNYSDGLYSVSEIMTAAIHAEIKYFSLTDHDSVEGTLETQKYGKEFGIQCFSGVELTVNLADNAANSFFHLLAYDFEHAIMHKALEDFNIKNSARYEALANELHKDGYDFELVTRNPKRNYYKFIDVIFSLFSAENVKDRYEAFKIIDNSKYTEYRDIRLSKEEAMKIIRDANGIAIMAHPIDIFKDSRKIPVTENDTKKIVQDLYELGIDGIEVFYEPYTDKQVKFLNKLADKYNFLKSVGTDFHGRKTDKLWHSVAKQSNLLLDRLLERNM